MKRIGIIALLLLCTTCANAGRNYRSGGTLVPSPASAVGYTTNTFSTTQFSASNIDLEKTYNSGFQWYLNNFFGANTPASAVTLNADGSVSIEYNDSTLFTAARIPGGVEPYFKGTAFGCGAYITAEMAFDPSAIEVGHGNPALWSMAIEHLASMPGQHWDGQVVNYDHFIELDIMEFNRDQTSLPDTYGSTMHDTYGVGGSTCPPGYCLASSDWAVGTVQTPRKTDFKLYHRYAALWVPATDSTKGYVEFYFDDIAMARFSWDKFTTQTPPISDATPWRFGVLDQQHLGISFGSGSGAVRVRSFDVWQGSGACNITN